MFFFVPCVCLESLHKQLKIDIIDKEKYVKRVGKSAEIKMESGVFYTDLLCPLKDFAAYFTLVITR